MRKTGRKWRQSLQLGHLSKFDHMPKKLKKNRRNFNSYIKKREIDKMGGQLPEVE